MKYSNYTIDQLMAHKGYQDMCNRFLSLAKDQETKNKLESILFEGGYANYVPRSRIGKNNPLIDIQRRLSLAYLLIRNPDSFDKLIETNVTFFHGTQSSAISSILTNGLNSHSKSVNDGINVTTGEESTRMYQTRDFISFTDVLDLAEDYASIKDASEDDTFPVVFGTSLNYMEKANFTSIGSDLPELVVMNRFPKEYLKIMIVPTNKVSLFKDIIPEGINVIGVDDIGNRFYYVDDFGKFYVDEPAYQKLKNELLTKDSSINKDISGYRSKK